MQGPVAIILAAGHGKRMQSDKAKVLHEVCGRPMIRYVVEAARGAGAKTILVVIGYGGDQVRAALADEPDLLFVEQARQLGTGDAVRVCRPALEGYHGPALVLVGDEPLLRPEPLADLLTRQQAEQADALLGTAILPDPTGFGRILRDTAGHFLRIIEQRDCRPEELAIREVNPSCYVFALPGLWEVLDQLDTRNAQREYYLTDAPALLLALGRKVLALPVLEPDDVLGVNTRQHLAQANTIMQARIQERLMTAGVTIVDPRSIYIDGRAAIGRDTTVFPFTVITGTVKVGQNCRIGPFAHLRDGTVLEDGVEVGAFVEVNRSHLEPGVTARHLAYLGDAHVGARSNIGAGVITANYDGRRKARTEVGEGAFLGSGAILVAPVTIGPEAVVGAGAVVTKQHDVPAGQIVVGVPARPFRPKER
ncbi:MAG: bifunctional N-acetylglucosamine-1-phosphate uridyltransferase/glucosamine-1-phosphate acetyltransferase [Isosphaeraceae bacterium]|nr:bifunctional N-acetylglucosamine-1-phosphate uridyltransferase/glucosamine-1-phosphate acetyltransferase [Isosphaeraceae bacterium]